MKINEYKNDVNSLTLSNEFKQELKEKMLAAAENSKPAKPAIKKSTAAVFSAKYSRYIALAACLLLVISTVSIVSIGGLKSKLLDSARESANDSSSIDNEQDLQRLTEQDDDIDDVDDIADAPADVPTSAIDTSEDDPVGDDETTAVDAHDDSDEEPVAVDSIPRSGNGYSSYASRDYEGSYNGEEYIISNRVGSASNTAEYISDYVNVNQTVVIEPWQNKTNENTNDDNIDRPVESTEADDPESTTPTASVDNDVDIESFYHDSNPMTSTTAANDLTFDELTSGWSYSYYGLRDGVIADLDGIALIRFTIENSYSISDVSRNISSPVTIDPYCQTLYDINITYDYFENESIDVDRMMLNTGLKYWQLIGRPLMEGEYIALVTENNDGVLEPVSQLIYAVHRVNGLDIAYHVYSDDGFMIDPGSTNMGLMPEEREVITSTTNNPEIYTQKAAVRELTYYLRRNILRMDPKLLDLKKVSSKTDDSAAHQEEIVYRSTVRANFPTGRLLLTLNGDSIRAGNFSATEENPIKVNGIGVGDDMQTALKAFYLSDYYFTPDAQITLIASEEDGKWQVTVKFSDNVVTEINVRS